MDIVGKARKLERRISRSVDAAVGELLGESGASSSPIEIVHAVVDAAEQQVQEAGRGRRLFPFNRVILYVPAAARDRETRARFAAVTDGPPSLTSRVRERLQAIGCKTDDLSADIVYVPKPLPEWRSPEFHVDFERIAPAPAPPAAAPAPVEIPRLRLTVVSGTADRRTYLFEGGRIDIGRRSEVVDARQRVVRTNHVAFAEDGADVNRTVSRRHAHIIYSATAHEYRLWDDRSAHGTSVLRGGRTIPVPSGARGTRLQSGDEVVVGQARLRVTFESPSSR
jgi:FHA domain